MCSNNYYTILTFYMTPYDLGRNSTQPYDPIDLSLARSLKAILSYFEVSESSSFRFSSKV